jgi:hypothetical protein
VAWRRGAPLGIEEEPWSVKPAEARRAQAWKPHQPEALSLLVRAGRGLRSRRPSHPYHHRSRVCHIHQTTATARGRSRRRRRRTGMSPPRTNPMGHMNVLQHRDGTDEAGRKSIRRNQG